MATVLKSLLDNSQSKQNILIIQDLILEARVAWKRDASKTNATSLQYLSSSSGINKIPVSPGQIGYSLLSFGFVASSIQRAWSLHQSYLLNLQKSMSKSSSKIGTIPVQDQPNHHVWVVSAHRGPKYWTNVFQMTLGIPSSSIPAPQTIPQLKSSNLPSHPFFTVFDLYSDPLGLSVNTSDVEHTFENFKNTFSRSKTTGAVWPHVVRVSRSSLVQTLEQFTKALIPSCGDSSMPSSALGTLSTPLNTFSSTPSTTTTTTTTTTPSRRPRKTSNRRSNSNQIKNSTLQGTSSSTSVSSDNQPNISLFIDSFSSLCQGMNISEAQSLYHKLIHLATIKKIVLLTNSNHWTKDTLTLFSIPSTHTIHIIPAPQCPETHKFSQLKSTQDPVSLIVGKKIKKKLVPKHAIFGMAQCTTKSRGSSQMNKSWSLFCLYSNLPSIVSISKIPNIRKFKIHNPLIQSSKLVTRQQLNFQNPEAVAVILAKMQTPSGVAETLLNETPDSDEEVQDGDNDTTVAQDIESLTFNVSLTDQQLLNKKKVVLPHDLVRIYSQDSSSSSSSSATILPTKVVNDPKLNQLSTDPAPP